MFSFIQNILGKEEINYAELLQRNALIIDVRTPQEYAQGHVAESINIPLGQIQVNLKEIQQQNKPIVTCCRSGARSGKAASILQSAGIEVYNGGSWNQVQAALNS